jgi:sRNA-binding carbon storage regulator CsrA
MLVLSRAKDESVMVGDDLKVTVLRVRGKRALIVVARRRAGGPQTFWEEKEPRWLDIGGWIELGEEMWCGLVDVAAEKTRLGFTLPAGVSLHRKEFYDLVNRERERGRGFE